MSAEATEQLLRARTCIGCGKASTKDELLRIVRQPDGSVGFDPTGRKPGRGAYVCSGACFAKARKTGRLARSLRTRIDEGLYEEIEVGLARSCAKTAGSVEE